MTEGTPFAFTTPAFVDHVDLVVGDVPRMS